MLRVAERFGQDPRTVLEHYSPGLQMLLMDFETLRESEEIRLRAVFSSGGGI